MDQGSLLICNLVNGVDSYVLSADSSLRHTQSYRQPIRCNVTLQVASALQGTWVIAGSDDGSVRIFDQRSGELIKSLRHTDDSAYASLLLDASLTILQRRHLFRPSR